MAMIILGWSSFVALCIFFIFFFKHLKNRIVVGSWVIFVGRSKMHQELFYYRGLANRPGPFRVVGIRSSKNYKSLEIAISMEDNGEVYFLSNRGWSNDFKIKMLYIPISLFQTFA